MRVQGLTRVAVAVAAVALLAGCSGSSAPGPTVTVTADATAAGGAPVKAGETTTLDLGGGAHLIIPPGAMADGARVSVNRSGAPKGTWTVTSPVGSPVQLVSDPPDAIHGLLTLEFPVPEAAAAKGVGVSTLDESTGTWSPWPASYDAARHMVVAQIPHFSWWNPTTWDWAGIFGRVNQDVGQILGRRASAPSCNGSGAPSWVNTSSIAGVTTDAAIAVRACVQSQGDVLDVQLTNNRPYGMVLHYGGPVKWGWHEAGSSMVDQQRNRLVDTLMAPDELYLPPLSRASVGIVKTRPGSHTEWHIGMTRESIVGEAIDLMGDLVGELPKLDCASYLAGAPIFDSLSASKLRDVVADAGGCVVESWTRSASYGALDSMKLAEIEGRLSALKKASVVGRLWTAYGYEWKVADLFIDQVWIGDGSGLGAGFSFNAKSEAVQPAPQPNPPAPQQPNPPAPQPSQPAPPPTQAPAAPTFAYNNYGSGPVVGHAMCRGNPGNSLSMPGGTASQTFSVPSGVGRIDSALVQIDPDSRVTAHLTVFVDGSARASADAAAAGDTRFSFGSVSVHSGQTVTLQISFTSTYGKIITVYTQGSSNGTFTAQNSCPDGAQSGSWPGAALRAQVSGWTR